MNREDIIFPGETIKELLEVNNLTQEDFARKMKINLKTANELINGKGVITNETAFKLGIIFDLPASFWNNLEFNYRAQLKEIEEEAKIKQEYEMIKDVYNEIAKRNWVPKTSNKMERVQNIKRYLRITDFENIDEEYSKIACRRSTIKNFSKVNLLLWVQYALRESTKLEVEKFDKEKILNSIEDIKRLTKYEDQKQARKELQQWGAERGIVIIYNSMLKNTAIQGIAKWLTPEKALIQLSDRRKRVDTFWFTFMHELGHLLYGRKKDCYLETDDILLNQEEEQIANEFAKNKLVNRKQYNELLKNIIITDDVEKDVIEFASQNNVAPDIVVGLLEYDLEKYDFKTFNKFLRRLEFE